MTFSSVMAVILHYCIEGIRF